MAGHIVLREAALDAELVKVDLKTKKTEKGEDFTAVNPKGYVPTLVLDDGDVLTENIAILPYLATLAPKLFPQSGKEHFHALERLGFVSTELHKSFAPLFKPTSGEAGKDAEQKAAKEKIAGRLKMAAAMLGKNEFMLGAEFSVVDAYLYVMLTWSKKKDVEIPSELVTYFDRLTKRPSIQAALQEEGLAS